MMKLEDYGNYFDYLKALNINKSDLRWVSDVLEDLFENNIISLKERNCLDLTLRNGGAWAFDVENW